MRYKNSVYILKTRASRDTCFTDFLSLFIGIVFTLLVGQNFQCFIGPHLQYIPTIFIRGSLYVYGTHLISLSPFPCPFLRPFYPVSFEKLVHLTQLSPLGVSPKELKLSFHRFQFVEGRLICFISFSGPFLLLWLTIHRLIQIMSIC